jgi:hypothetical protein
MKILFSILLFATLCTNLIFGQPDHVTDAPSWFFNPPQGTYAGVSVSFENIELAQQQAVYTALLSYVVQNNVEVTVENMGHILENSLDNSTNTETRLEFMNTLRWSLPNRYEVILSAINQYGELFVLLRVGKTNCNCTLDMNVEHYMLSTARNGAEDVRHRMDYGIQDRSIFNTVVDVNGFSRLYNENINQYLTVRVTSTGNALSSEQERFTSVARELSYNSIANHSVANETSSWSHFPLRYSLGMAYQMALLNGFVLETLDIGNAKNVPYKQEVDLSSRQKTTESSILRDMMFFTAQYKVTNPARALRVQIDSQGNLSLINS